MKFYNLGHKTFETDFNLYQIMNPNHACKKQNSTLNR